MGKGGSQNSTSQVYQTSLPKYAQPYYESLMGRAQAESTRPYQPYEGQRIADQASQTTTGMNMAQQFAQSGSPDLDNARSLSGMVGQQAMDMQNYQAGGVHNTYTAGNMTADQVGTGTFGQDQANQYMSPYMNDVTSAAQSEAARNAMQEQAMIKAQQGATGAFGGSRGAVQQQIAANAAQQRIADIGVQGRQSAYENAQQQFERDQGRGLQAQMANQSKNLEAMGMSEQALQRQSELGMNAENQTEQLRQSGKQLGLQGLQLAGSTAGQLADYQKLNDSMQMQRFQTMLGVGQMGEDRQQKALDMAYSDYQNQVNWPRQNLGFLSSMLASQPTGTNSSSTTTQPSNNIMGMAGSALGLQALYNMGRGTTS